MNWVGGGFIVIINYSGTSTEVVAIQHPILTENNLDLLAEDSNFLEVETV